MKPFGRLRSWHIPDVFVTLLALTAPLPAGAFYIPFFTTQSYAPSAPIPLLVNKAYSDATQLQYAYADLPFVCSPQDLSGGGRGGQGWQHVPLNLGEVLRGDRIMVAGGVGLRMGEDVACRRLCERTVDAAGVARARSMITDGYLVEWIIDNLPGATSFVTADRSRRYYSAGFRLGSVEDGRVYLHNHFTIVIRHRPAPGEKGERGERVVVGFEVYPRSIGGADERGEDGCPIGGLEHSQEKFELPPPLLPAAGGEGEGEGEAGSRDKSESKGKEGNEAKTGARGDDDNNDDDGAPLTIPYTYSIYFREDTSVEWSHRWDLYFVNQDEGARVHWMALVNSLIICAMLTAVVLVIMARTIRSDLGGRGDGASGGGVEKGVLPKTRRRPLTEKSSGLLVQTDDDQAAAGNGLSDNDGDDEDEGDDDDDDDDDDLDVLEDVAGWRLLNRDVFRPPTNGHLLAPLVGSGMQLLFTAAGLVLLGAVGVLNPSFRGGFISFAVGLFIFGGLFSGYYSARVFKTFGGRDWRGNTLVTALLVPGLLFTAVLVLNLFVWAQASSTAIPFTTLLAMAALWLGVQLPLVYAGSRYGFIRAGSWEHPSKTSAVPRPIPPQSYLSGLPAALLAGLGPFGVICIELLFVFQSVWQDKSGYYYLFGFLAVVSAILVIAVAEVTVVATYLQLCAGDYRWWWQSFVVGGASAVWVFAYCAWYYAARLHITGLVSSLLFFAYSFIACCVYGLLTGTVGFLAAYAFVRRIYGAIKVD